MKKTFLLITLLILGAMSLVAISRLLSEKNSTTAMNEALFPKVEEQADANVPNTASNYCKEQGGSTEVISGSDGSQYTMCTFDDYACEESAYFKGECDIAGDAEKIMVALKAKGLDLSNMQVVINKHLGKYIAGSVMPTGEPGGSGYVYAAKDSDGTIKIVADGNGVIWCSMLEDFPDFPALLIAECIDADGNAVTR